MSKNSIYIDLDGFSDPLKSIFLNQAKKTPFKKLLISFILDFSNITLVPYVIRFNKSIHINQILSSKIGNVIIEIFCKSYVTNKKRVRKN